MTEQVEVQERGHPPTHVGCLEQEKLAQGLLIGLVEISLICVQSEALSTQVFLPPLFSQVLELPGTWKTLPSVPTSFLLYSSQAFPLVNLFLVQFSFLSFFF